jgi:hypothetical protein
MTALGAQPLTWLSKRGESEMEVERNIIKTYIP